jgi:hypothetical protein
MKSRMNLQQVIAIANTPKAKALVKRYGYEPATSYNDLVSKLEELTRDYKEEGLADLIAIHPHKDVILYFEEEQSGACGCGGSHSSANGNNNNHGKGCKCPQCNRFSNFEYAEEYIDFLGSKKANGENPMQKFNDYLPMIAVAGLFALAITAIGKKA